MNDGTHIVNISHNFSSLKTCKAEIKRITFEGLSTRPEFDSLVSEYADECQISGLPRCKYDGSTYYLLENLNVIHFAAAFVNGVLVGFSSLIVTKMPHYSQILAVTESIFVSKEHRGSGAGMMLIREMEFIARDGGAIGILVSAPKGGRLNALMPNIGYSHTNEVFFKAIQ